MNDILINNLRTSQRNDFLEVSDEVWQEDLDLNYSPLFVCRGWLFQKCAPENGVVLSMY